MRARQSTIDYIDRAQEFLLQSYSRRPRGTRPPGIIFHHLSKSGNLADYCGGVRGPKTTNAETPLTVSKIHQTNIRKCVIVASRRAPSAQLAPPFLGLAVWPHSPFGHSWSKNETVKLMYESYSISQVPFDQQLSLR